MPLTKSQKDLISLSSPGAQNVNLGQILSDALDGIGTPLTDKQIDLINSIGPAEQVMFLGQELQEALTGGGSITQAKINIINQSEPAFLVTHVGNVVQDATSGVDWPTVETPVISPTAGTFETVQAVTISSATPGSVVLYSIDGSTPSLPYTGPITVATTMTIKAFAKKIEMKQSAEASSLFTITPRLATPTFDPPTGTYTSFQTCSISAPGAEHIYYTTDGSIPTSSSTEYTNPISIEITQTVKTFATKTGWVDSSVGSIDYTINLPALQAWLYEHVTLSNLTGTDGSSFRIAMMGPSGQVKVHGWLNPGGTGSAPTVQPGYTLVGLTGANMSNDLATALGCALVGPGNNFMSLYPGVVDAPSDIDTGMSITETVAGQLGEGTPEITQMSYTGQPADGGSIKFSAPNEHGEVKTYQLVINMGGTHPTPLTPVAGAHVIIFSVDFTSISTETSGDVQMTPLSQASVYLQNKYGGGVPMAEDVDTGAVVFTRVQVGA